MQSLKQNLTQFTWSKLLYCICSNKAKIWACYCCKVGCPTLLSLQLLILYNELVMLLFPGFSFIVFFLQSFWSKFMIFFKIFLKKPLLNYAFCFVFIPGVTFIFLLTFSCLSKSFRCFFLISWAFFFSFSISTVFFDYLLWFYVYFLQISLLQLQEVAYFQRALHLLGPYLWLFVLLWLASTFMTLVKWSLRLRVVPANSSEFFEVIGYILPYDSSFLTSTFTFKYTLARHACHQMNVLFLIPWHDRPKLTKGEKKTIPRV